MVKGSFPDLDGTYMSPFIGIQPTLNHSCHRIFLCELFSVFTDLLLHFLWELQQAALILRWPVDFHYFCPQLVKIGSGFFFIIEDMLLCLTAVYSNRQEPSCPGTVKRNELPCVRWTCKDTLTLPVFLIFIIRVPVSVFLSGQEWLDFLIALCTDCSNHLRHFHNPVSPEMLVYLTVIQLLQIIRKPVIVQCKKTEKCGFSGSLLTYQTKHFICFTTGAVDSA